MIVEVQLFARARDLAGTSQLTVEVPDRASVSQFRQSLGEQVPALRPLLPHLIVAIGTEYASDSTCIPAASRLTCFPPVSGG